MKTLFKITFSFALLMTISCNSANAQIEIGTIDKNLDGTYNPKSAKFTVDMKPYLLNWQNNLKKYSNIDASFSSVEFGTYNGSNFLRAKGDNIISTTSISIDGNKLVILRVPGASCTTKCCSSSTTGCILLMGGTCTECKKCDDCTRTQTSGSIMLAD